ncbi:MAG TPA: hypothetical protein VF581_12145 [Flavobacterium sp.]|jgi:hypothetical protein
MENLSNPKYHKQYLQGYAFGNNPAFAEFEDINNCTREFKSEAFKSGFASGRSEYERINGPLSHGIPHQILSQKILQEFLMLGRLGMPLEASEYSEHQQKVIQQYYGSGRTFYNCDGDISLYLLLADSGISWKY